jgi:hypothetical protein
VQRLSLIVEEASASNSPNRSASIFLRASRRKRMDAARELSEQPRRSTCGCSAWGCPGPARRQAPLTLHARGVVLLRPLLYCWTRAAQVRSPS